MITAFVSLACNIFNLIALGHLPCMPHREDNFMDAVTSVYKPHGGHTCSHNHGHGHSHGHSHGEGVCSGHNHNHDHDHKHDHNHDHEHQHHDDENADNHGKKPHIQSIISSTSESPDAIVPSKKLLSGLGGLIVEEEIAEVKTTIETPHLHHDHHQHAEEENINIRAAVVHVIGDMLQSIGVIIASVLIYIWPETKTADPICTYLFSILVIITTIPVFKDCMVILMESKPKGVEPGKI